MEAAPAWADNLRNLFKTGWDSASNEEIVVEPREEVTLKHTRFQVVYREDSGDVIFQVFPESQKWPGPGEAREFLAAVIEDYFGDTSRFSASYVPELESWGIRASGLLNLPSYDKDFHVDRFLHMMDDTVDAL